MCGVCGVYDPDGAAPLELILRMMTALRHRGPDGSGWYRDDVMALGHTRLSIVDLAGGTQPMAGEEERVWVVFNGEIFNHVELARELTARGHRFRTASDTEVIVHAWEEWGPDCFRRFNGQWALALWDRVARQLVLSRDRYGIHPLFYAATGRRVAFASEIKALFCDPGVRRELDPDGLDDLLTTWSAGAPRTLFEGIRQVLPGTWLTIDARGMTTGEYWAPAFPPQGSEPDRDIDENTERLREAVVDATRLRFQRSDVPVGAYLSGGIDSAVTAAVIAGFADTEVHTFSLRFTDAEFDEGHHQQLMHERLGTAHRELVVSGRDIAEALPEVVWHAESALLRAAPAPMMLLSRLVHAEGYKVVVTGEGADEVLAGYDIFREAKVRALMAEETDPDARLRLVEQLYPWMRRSPAQVPAFAQSFFNRPFDPDDLVLSHRPRWQTTSSIQSMLAPDLRVSGSAAADRVIAAIPAGADRWDPLSRAQWLEMRTLLPGYLLSSQGDRMLMAASVEGRFPFLDHRVFEVAARIPAEQKLRGLDEKHLLKRAFADLVPAEIIDRPKQPYRAPDAASIFVADAPGRLTEATSPDAVTAAGIWDPRAVQLLWDKALRSGGRGMGNTDNMRVMAVLTSQLLHQMLVQDWRAPEPTPPTPVAAFHRTTIGTREPVDHRMSGMGPADQGR
ncbi:asparagine synthase (glutamine-hydrolyzing) [Microbacterium sp. nov. GSS16]|uniref:asparagine synthase (glutamine-hydrolyzing) n=1 Tax=Microbacterium sp. nov. GSS16 TaxID=3019890 RepID=UPI0023066208|nr:asparagine synthase (glutamine-hydrolyzing) [Microbacterium sp. nov. GSS16]WCD92922.1 asparagine synthase (glutamine-hydrolyzing) [Microbacterium sp. nov. GSS16]